MLNSIWHAPTIVAESVDVNIRSDTILASRSERKNRVTGEVRKTMIRAKAGVPIRRAPLRALDIALGAIGLVVAMPILVTVALAILIESGRPVFFIQERLGRNRRPFRMIKFRTMATGAESNGPQWAVNGDPRVTRLGRLLRRTRFDELPQLWNVLKGDMSFIGPRPIREEFAQVLERHDPTYGARFNVKPGITGWAQLDAPYGSTVEEQLEKLPYDLRYLNGIGPGAYARILARTAVSVLRAQGR